LKQTDNKTKKLGIKWKLFLCLCAFTAVVITVLWLCQVVFFENIYKATKLVQIERTADQIAESIDEHDLADRIDRLAADREACILILELINEQFALQRYSSSVLSDCLIHRMPINALFAFYNSASENGGSEVWLLYFDENTRQYKRTDGGLLSSSDGHDAETIIHSSVVQNSSGEKFIILINMEIVPVGATVSTINALLAVISVLLILLSMIVAFIISRLISKPIIDINKSAKQLALGNYEVSFSNRGYREISELADTLNHAARELSKVDGMRRELIANISHDLRTPLTMISGYSEVMTDIPGENTPENAKIIADEARRLTSLVNDILDVSKIESGTCAVYPERLDITETVAQVVNRYSKLTGRDGYSFDFIYEENICATTDKTRFLQALYNLINNAVTYTGEDKKVIIKQVIESDGIKIEVTDSGEGIPEDQLPLIWDRYYKVNSAHRRAALGSGLGLSIVRNVMNMLGGSYGVTSTQGKGSTFWIKLPKDRGEDLR